MNLKPDLVNDAKRHVWLSRIIFIKVKNNMLDGTDCKADEIGKGMTARLKDIWKLYYRNYERVTNYFKINYPYKNIPTI
jgi:hypothetical protein